MSLSSSSTIDEVKAAYVDNADYDTAQSTAKAILFIQACRILLLKTPASMAVPGGVAVTMSPAIIQQQLQDAQTFLALHQDPYGALPQTGGGVRHFSLRNYRGEYDGGGYGGCR